MKAQSDSQSQAVKTFPHSTQGILSATARFEAYPSTFTRQRGKTNAMPLSAVESRSSQKESQLKAAKQGPIRSGNFSTVKGAQVPSPMPSSKPRAATISTRPTSQASKKHATSVEASRNATQATTPVSLTRKQVLLSQGLGPENWTPITAKVNTDTPPPPKMKIHRHKRGTILPEVGTTSIFRPGRFPPNQNYKGVFHDREIDSSPPLSRSPSPACLPDPTSAALPDQSSPPEQTSELPTVRRTISLSRRHLKTRARADSKTVTWDPSIISVGPKIQPTTENGHEGGQQKIQDSVSSKQVPDCTLEVRDCVETIKAWGKTDKSKIVSLIEALKDLKLEGEDQEKVEKASKSSTPHDVRVVITTVKSLNPRVPEFESIRNTNAKDKTYHAEEQNRNTPHDSDDASRPVDSDGNKENIPEKPLKSSLKPQAPKKKKRPITVLDDINDPGREVDAFADWYGELQLREFAKKYPLTGRRVSEVRQQATAAATTNLSHKVHQNTGKSNVSIVSGASNMASSETQRGNGTVSTLREDVVVGEQARPQPEVGEAKRAESPPRQGRGYDGRNRRNGLRGGNGRPPRDDDPLLAKRNAAVIQERLEVLLLKERERKAFEEMMAGKPARAVGRRGNNNINNNSAFCEAWVGNVRGGGIARAGGGGAVEWQGTIGSGAGGGGGSDGLALAWIPSERLRLSKR